MFIEIFTQTWGKNTLHSLILLVADEQSSQTDSCLCLYSCYKQRGVVDEKDMALWTSVTADLQWMSPVMMLGGLSGLLHSAARSFLTSAERCRTDWKRTKNII